MRKTALLVILIFSVSFSQTELITPSFSADAVLFYDTIFNQPINNKLHIKHIIDFNEKTIKRHIGYLNNRTPLNLIYNKTIGQYIKFYLFQREKQVAKLLALSEYYFPIFEAYLDKNKLPMELKYLPIIESSLNPNARSPAGAVGLWQFMYATAKEQGLRINSYLDERKDTDKSTQAACDYLNKAYKVFNNWELAIASYNSGRGNITKAIRRSGGKLNYWEIKPFLPKETGNYIPALIAAIYVMNYAHHYGIVPDTNYLFKSHEIDSVYLKRAVKIDHLARLLDIDTALLESLNPVYKLKLIPHLENENFSIILPSNKSGLFIANEDSIYLELAKLESSEQLEYPELTEVEKIRYKVKRGDYLDKIAKKYNCKTSDIILWNDMKSTTIKIGQRLNIYHTIK